MFENTFEVMLLTCAFTNLLALATICKRCYASIIMCNKLASVKFTSWFTFSSCDVSYLQSNYPGSPLWLIVPDSYLCSISTGQNRNLYNQVDVCMCSYRSRAFMCVHVLCLCSVSCQVYLSCRCGNAATSVRISVLRGPVHQLV